MNTSSKLPSLRATRNVARAIFAGFCGALIGAANCQNARAAPVFNVPQMSKAPTIDGIIGVAEWKNAVSMTGAAPPATSVSRSAFYVRPVTFWVAWDADHLYIAGRSAINPGEKLIRGVRDKFARGTVFDDSYEFGLGLLDRNKVPGEASSFFKFIINSLGAGEYTKIYPTIGQHLLNWTPDASIGNRITPDGKWWETEIALDRQDLQLPAPQKIGDVVRILLARNFKNPNWVQAHVPSDSGFQLDVGYPQGTLTADAPFAQMQQLDGLLDNKVKLRLAVTNPSAKAVRVKVQLKVRKDFRNPTATPETALTEERVLEIAARGTGRFDVDHDLSTLLPQPAASTPAVVGDFDLRVTLANAPQAKPVFTSYFQFTPDAVKTDLVSKPSPPFRYAIRFNPVRSNLSLEADTLDADIPAGSKVAALQYEVRSDKGIVKQGRLNRLINFKFDDVIQLPPLKEGKYRVVSRLVDARGKALLSQESTIEKKNEAKAFPAWWKNKIGNVERVLPPFTPMTVKKNTVSVAMRDYTLDALGMPNSIRVKGAPLLSSPARFVVTVGGKEYPVPVSSKLNVTGQKAWRVAFTGSSQVAGIRFTSRGTLEQDGLSELFVTYQPLSKSKPVLIQALRMEWPVDDTLKNRMIVIGPGGNYSVRKIGDVPAGQGKVWSTLDLGHQASGMTAGNFFQQVWVGTEQRGLLWTAESDEGWVINEKIAAHELVRRGKTLFIRNNIIGTPQGEKPFVLNAPRTIHFGFNASPFKPQTAGWRLNQRSARNGFSGGRYKINWETGFDGWSALSPPTPKLEEWPKYYAEYKQIAATLEARGLYGIRPRLELYLCNQIPLHGYHPRTLEPGVYDYFAAEWLSNGNETLVETFADYTAWLQRRQVREGGARAFYYDLSFGAFGFTDLGSGEGYRLPNGRIQPTGGDFKLRRYVMRINAMMQEEGLYPAGISGHATNSFALAALPWYDGMLDSEFPMTDPIVTYPSDRMIAMSHSGTFGTTIDHLSTMNPHWAAMHDSNIGGGDPWECIFDKAEFRHWGIGQADMQFIPYWRNHRIVKSISQGLIASMWKRPNSLVVELMNHGPDAAGKEKMRAARMTLDLKALGVPQNVGGLRIREFERSRLVNPAYLPYSWVASLPRSERHGDYKVRPEIAPTIDAKSGAISGFDINYHDQRFLIVSWDEAPQTADGGVLHPNVVKQIEALQKEKEGRTPAQQKIDSQLLQAIKMRRGEPVAEGIPTLEVDVQVDAAGRTVVDISAQVSKALLKKLSALGADIESSFPRYNSIRALVPLDKIEDMAALPEIRFIMPKQLATTNRAETAQTGVFDPRTIVDESLPASAPAADIFSAQARIEAVEWGLDRRDTKLLSSTEIARDIRVRDGTAQVMAWKRPNSVLLRLNNAGNEAKTVVVDLNSAGLGIKVPQDKVWEQFTQIYDLENKPVANVVWSEVEKNFDLQNGGTALFDGWKDQIVVNLKAQETRYLAIDKD